MLWMMMVSCATTTDACKAFADAAASCNDDTVTNEEIDACREELESCSEADELALIDYVECAFVCDTTTTTTGIDPYDDLTRCLEPIETLDEACRASVGFLPPAEPTP